MPAVSCPHCGASLKAPDTAVGKKLRCNRCKKSFAVSHSLATSAGSRPRSVDLGALPAPDPLAVDPLSLAAAPALPPVGANTPSAERSSVPRWLIPVLAASGAVILLAAIGGVFWTMSGSTPSGGQAAAAKPEGASPAPPVAEEADGVFTAPAMDPAPGPQSWVCQLENADSAGWKVSPEPATSPAKLTSAIPLAGGTSKVVFAAPRSGIAAGLRAISPERIEWTQYDLQSGEARGRVEIPLAKPATAPVKLIAGLSALGKQLAMVDPTALMHVEVWSQEGEQMGAVELAHEVSWVGLASPTRLLVLSRGQLSSHSLATGKREFEIAARFTGTPAFSPGRRWIGGFTGEAFEWFDARDGASAGRLPLPKLWHHAAAPEAHCQPKLIVHPDGKSVAGLAYNNDKTLLVAVWDLDSGVVRESFCIPYAEAQHPFGTAATWCGNRQLLASTGQLLDLDLRTWVTQYTFLDGLEGSPDGRLWRMLEVELDKIHEVAEKLSSRKEEFRKNGILLAAVTLPDKGIRTLLEAARAGVLWHPGMELRVEVDDSCPARQRDKILAALTEGAADHGFHVDPQARHRLRIAVPRGKQQSRPRLAKTAGDFLKQATLTVLDERGKPIMELPAATTDFASDGGEDAAMLQLRSKVSSQRFPRFYLRNSQGKRLYAPIRVPVGIDGILDPPQGPQYDKQTGADVFSLPTDPIEQSKS